jgi:outer membrane protein assembly factor BamB
VSDSGLALPTPACDANGVYAIFGTGDLAAFSHEGKPKWQIFLKRPVLGYGFASSPCVIDNLVCIQFDDYSDGRVLAVETSTGKTKWEHARSRGAAWSSPIIVRGDDGKPLFIVNANGSITAFDLTGKLAWDVDGVAGEVAPSPTWWKGHVYAVNAGSRLLCYKVSDNTKELWHRGGSLSDAASPVVVNGLFFMVTGDSRLVCLDAITGEELWKQRSPSTYASLVASGDRIYSLGRDGTMLIVAAERTYRLIATCALGEGADATPAMAANRIYIRGREHLWCIGAK